MKKFIFIFLFSFGILFSRGITNEELGLYFNEFIKEFPALKFSGFFSNINDKKTGLHISNCIDNECEIRYSDYTNYKGEFSPFPECESAQKLKVVDSTHAMAGDAVIRIIDDKMQIFGEISFTCFSSDLAYNLSKLDVEFDPLDSDIYEIVLKDSILNAHFNYPINLNCLNRDGFSARQLCVEPFFSDSYSFNQFFIFLAARNPESFRFPNKIYYQYKVMQAEISLCSESKYKEECIYAALGKFDSKIKDNLIINETPQVVAHYKLLR